jgi:hypothetical protein
VRDVPDELRTGSRRALPLVPVLAVDASERAALMEQAVADPQREWVLQEFDGRRFVERGRVRGPVDRAAFLAGGQPAARGAATGRAPARRPGPGSGDGPRGSR